MLGLSEGEFLASVDVDVTPADPSARVLSDSGTDPFDEELRAERDHTTINGDGAFGVGASPGRRRFRRRL